MLCDRLGSDAAPTRRARSIGITPATASVKAPVQLEMPSSMPAAPSESIQSAVASQNALKMDMEAAYVCPRRDAVLFDTVAALVSPTRR